MRVEGPAAGVGADALLAAAEHLQAGLGHRRVEFEDESAAARVRETFIRRGWHAEVLLWMHRDGASGDAGAPADVEEVVFAETRGLRRLWHGAEDPDGDPGAAEIFLDMEDAVAQLRRPRAFAVRDGGRAIAFATLWAPPGDDADEIEQVFVAPDRRGEGLGGALVAAAVRASARPRHWIVADDEGRPKHLYARLGFAGVWRQHAFVRRPQNLSRNRTGARRLETGSQLTRRPPA